MTLQTGSDLGHAVRVVPGEAGGLVVQSPVLDLGWRVRVGGEAGSAVVWRDASFEVVSRESCRNGHRWFLEPWTGEQVMRVVLPLDESVVNDAAEEAERIARAAERRMWMWLFLPLLGMAPESWQRRWRDEWNFPAALATSVSAILEALFGVVCLLEVMAHFGAGSTIFSWIPRWMLILGVVFLPEGLMRLARVFADSEPVGSTFGLIATVFHRSKPSVEAPLPVPTVQTYDGAEGLLVLGSPIQRRDWEEPGILPYRDEFFTLSGVSRLGETWCYSFGRDTDGENGAVARLRLAPPRAPSGLPLRDPPPNVVRVSLLTAVACLAPGRFQERWARELGVRPMWLTVLGAGAELVGGMNNLGSSRESDAGAVLLAVFFVVEAVVRFGFLASTGRPMGSLLGWPLAPLLEKVMPEP